MNDFGKNKSFVIAGSILAVIVFACVFCAYTIFPGFVYSWLIGDRHARKEFRMNYYSSQLFSSSPPYI